MTFKCLVVILVLLGSTSGQPFTLHDPPSAEGSATNNAFAAQNGYFHLQNNSSGSSTTILYINGGNVSISLNGLPATNGLNNKSEESSISIGTSVTEPARDQSRSIGSDYIVTNNSQKYKLHIEEKNWLEASQICFHEGGHLVVINSKAEEELVLNMAKSVDSPKGVWIGVHNIFKTGVWTTVENLPLSKVGYEHWGPIEPIGKYNLCVSLKCDGLSNWRCESMFPFVCEIEPNH